MPNTFRDEIELYEEKYALYYDGIMDSDYALVRSILKKHPELINATIDVPMDEEDIEEAEDGEFSRGKTPLHGAISYSDVEMVKLLVEEFHTDIDKGDYEEFTAIFKLSAKGIDTDEESYKYRKMADYLLDKGVDVNHAIYTGKTPLMLAAQAGNIYMVTKLLEYGANVEAMDRNDYNVFQWFGYYDGEEESKEDEETIETIVKLLLEYGADINNIDKYNDTPLDMAEQNDKFMVAKIFKKYMYEAKKEETQINDILPDDFLDKN